MSYVVTPMPVQVNGNTSSAPMAVKPMQTPGVQPQMGGADAMNQLAQALMKAKRSNLLSNKLPGTTPQSLGLGTAMSDAGSVQAPPQPAFNGNSGPLNA